MADIEKQLKSAMQRSGRSILNLSKSANVPYSAVHGFVTGDRRITLRSAAKLARELGLELKPKPRKPTR